MKQKTIALWMYRNEGGDVIQEKLKKMLEEKNIRVINDFDIRECYCLEGRVFTQNGFDLSSADVFYHMNADEQSPYQNEILRAIELSGVKVINSWDSYNTARNKFWTNTLLKANGINVPPALFVNAKQAIKLAKFIFEKWEKILVKQTSRHGGKGIILFDNIEQFIDFIEATENSYQSYYIEKFIESEDHDYRAEIINHKIVYGISRLKKEHSYKTNTHSGGHYIPLELPKECKQVAIKATKILNIDCSIVDMIKSTIDKKIYILEINPIMGIFIQAYEKLFPEISKNLSSRYDEKKMNAFFNFLTTH